MKRKLHKIRELIDEINGRQFLYVTGQSFYLKNKKYFSDSNCKNEIDKSFINDFNEAERLKNNSETAISFIIHK